MLILGGLAYALHIWLFIQVIKGRHAKRRFAADAFHATYACIRALGAR